MDNTNKRYTDHSHENQDKLISRARLAERWGVSAMTIKRKEKEGQLPVIRFNERLVRYRLSDVIAIERENVTESNPDNGRRKYS